MKRRPIRSRIIVLFLVAMLSAAAGTFVLILAISASVMQKTLRGYLVSAVETSTDDLIYEDVELTDWEKALFPHDVFISYRGGYIRVDEDFLDEMNNVKSGLYEENGRMLYGQNPLTHCRGLDGFRTTGVYKVEEEGTEYYVYDRRIQVDGISGLWIRGAVPLTEETRQISEILRVSLLFLPLLAALAAVFGYLAARGILKPLRRMTGSASAIATGNDLEKRIELSGVHDEIQELGLTINEMLDRLENSFEAEKRFASDASHELRTPVAVIMAQTELALEHERDREELRSALEVVRRQGRRLETLIRDMLDFTRMDQHLDRYPMEELDFSALVSTICEDMRLISLRGIILTPEICSGIRLMGNEALLTRLLQNLIDNAYRYGRKDGHIEVRLGMREDPSTGSGAASAVRTVLSGGKQGKKRDMCAVLAVADDGMGIPPEDMDHLFERFFRGERSRNKDSGGNGLGLAMVSKIAELHGASVLVDSTPGEGSTFSVIFREPALKP